MAPQNLQTLLEFFKALSHESRLKLLGILAQRECSVEELAVLLHRSPPTVSHHLAKLKALNLVTLMAEGNTHLYRLNSEQLQSLSRAILTPDQLESFTVDVAPQDWETKVLKSFMDGDRITDIPASRKKRLVVLKWLVRQFAVDRDYPEKELNAVIKRHHPDTATLRREFIGYKLMTRENGIYRRLPESDWLEEATNFN
jgi:predicted transcriptional regulator